MAVLRNAYAQSAGQENSAIRANSFHVLHKKAIGAS